MCTLLSHLTKKHKNILWSGGGGDFQMLHPALACDLASCRIFLSLSCLPTSFKNKKQKSRSAAFFSLFSSLKFVKKRLYQLSWVNI